MAIIEPRAKSIRQVAAYLRVSPKTVREFIRARLMMAIDVGRKRQQLRVTPAALSDFERRQSVRPAVCKSRRGTDGIDPAILRFLDEE